MVGWHLLLLLVIEVALYGAAGRHMHAARGWSVPSSIALAVAIYVSVRVVLVGTEFLLARWKGASIPAAMRVGPAGLLAMYLRELGGWLLMFTFVMPFVLSRRSVLDRPARVPSDDLPLLLVHGLVCNRGNWFWFRRQLEQRGYRRVHGRLTRRPSRRSPTTRRRSRGPSTRFSRPPAPNGWC